MCDSYGGESDGVCLRGKVNEVVPRGQITVLNYQSSNYCRGVHVYSLPY